MYGWKGRIGVLIPAPNTTTEPEFNRMAPEGVSIHATRMALKDATPPALMRMEKEIYKAASLMAQAKPDVLVMACTSGSFIKGVGYDRKLIEKVTRQTQVKTLTSSTAVIAALKLLGITKVAVATPYVDEVNAKEKEFIEENGIRVTCMKGLGRASGMGLLEPHVAYKLAIEVDSLEAEGVFISCTNFRTIEILEALEKNRGKPVISSNQASMALALRALGIRQEVRGFGSLFAALSGKND